MVDAENPFAPPEPATEPPPPSDAKTAAEKHAPRTPAVSLAVWTCVCVVSAAPSFFWGLGTVAKEQYLAMILGVCVFIALYTWVDQFTQLQAWRRVFPVPLTLKIGYITRLLLSVVFPIGAGLDLICGLMSVGIVESILPTIRSHPGGAADMEGEVGFLGAFIITLVQGITLNFVLLCYMSVVFGILATFKSRQS